MVRENDAECRRIAESAAEMATFLTEHSIYAEIQTFSGSRSPLTPTRIQFLPNPAASAIDIAIL
jgi:hypothetical protein